jgi:hypothetical protein
LQFLFDQVTKSGNGPSHGLPPWVLGARGWVLGTGC